MKKSTWRHDSGDNHETARHPDTSMPTIHPATLLALTLLATPAAADWPAYADRDDVCLVVHELESGNKYVSNPERCNEPRHNRNRG